MTRRLRLTRLNLLSVTGALLLGWIAAPSIAFAQPPRDQRPGGPPPREGDRDAPRDGDRGRPRFGGPRSEGARGFGGPPPADGDGRRGRGQEMVMRLLPVMRALDADNDGVLSASEIENATAALKRIDRNGDGKLTADEMRPDFDLMPGRSGAAGRRGEMDRRTPDGDSPEGRRPEMDRRDSPPGRGDAAGRGDSARPGRDGDRFGGVDPRTALARMFQQRDVNKDGKLSGDEIPPQMASRLERVDTDGDGAVSKEEIDKMLERFRGSGGGNQRSRPGRGGGDDAPAPGGDIPRRPPVEE